MQILHLLLAVILGSSVHTHPQDGPHADLRLAVEPDGVRFSIGVNLAFMDEIDPIPRELDDAVAPSEADRIRERMERFCRDEIAVEIDGVAVTPVIESFQFFTEPDEGMIALYPRLGARALIRSTTILVYPAKSLPDVVRVTWPVYPPDLLGAEMEGLTGAGGGPPRMFIETQVRGEGVLKMHRFSEAEPTIEWRSAAAGGGIVFADVPEPSTSTVVAGDLLVSSEVRVPMLSAVAAVITLFAAASVIMSLARGRRAWVDVIVLVAAGGATFALRDVALIDLPGTKVSGGRTVVSSVEAPTDEEAVAIFEALHANMYRSFDYTDESDVYDALARSVEGPLLEELYNQIYDSLVQAEQDNMLGVVTAVEPIEVHVLKVDRPIAGILRFIVRHRWRVAGTVYHWGHAHTRVIEYDAEYDVGTGEDGWRLIGQTMHEQWRLDPDLPDEI